MLFYPFSLATIAAGFLAFIMIVLNFDTLVISNVVLWYYFACVASIYTVSARALGAFGLSKFFLGFTITIGVLAVLSAAALIWREVGR